MTSLPLIHRPRRLRRSEALRAMVCETRLSRYNLVQPVFIADGNAIEQEVPSMPGVYQFSLDRAKREIDDLSERGVQSIILFGVPDSTTKDALGSVASHRDGIVPRAIAQIKRQNPELLVIADVCLCSYTESGHCGLVGEKGEILNDKTLPLLADTALVYAEAGADMIAPSDMMDGRVAEIRATLDSKGFSEIPIMSYSVKQASSLYAPFREAAHSAPQFGDRKSYQMDPANAREAVREARLDVEEGADIIMVKPALTNLDLIRTLYECLDCPVAAYQVSGEYAMIKAAAARGWIGEKEVVRETLTAIKRAGAQMIISYFSKEITAEL